MVAKLRSELLAAVWIGWLGGKWATQMSFIVPSHFFWRAARREVVVALFLGPWVFACLSGLRLAERVCV